VWRLDHVLYTARTLQVLACWQTLEADATSARDGLPNRACPSDHLPVGAAFAVAPPPVLPDEAARGLASRLVALTRTQVAERATLADELEAEQRKLAEELQPQAAAAPPPPTRAPPEEGAGPKAKSKAKAKAKGKGKAPPSEAEILLLRARRERERELKIAHREQRESFVSGLSELETDALEAWLEPAEWLERGQEARGIAVLLKDEVCY